MTAVSTADSPGHIISPCNLPRKRFLSPDSACRRTSLVRTFTAPSASSLAVDLDANFIVQLSPISKTPKRCLLDSLRSSETPKSAELRESMDDDDDDDDIFKTKSSIEDQCEKSKIYLPTTGIPDLFHSPSHKYPLISSEVLTDFKLRKVISSDLIEEEILSPIRQCNMARSRKTAPPPKLRKMHSMCEIQEQFIYGDSPKSQVEDNHGESYILPCYTTKKDTLKRISPDTLCDVLSGKYDGSYDRLIIIDCRFPYEYEGGHIQNAMNLNTKESLDKFFFENAQVEQNSRTIVVFHCEYSSHRAPRMAHHLRSLDRELNTASYPRLCYPELYVLDGGYRNFFAQTVRKTHCVPPNYIEMDDKDFKSECKAQMAKFTKSFNQKLKNKSIRWSRSNSF